MKQNSLHSSSFTLSIYCPHCWFCRSTSFIVHLESRTVVASDPNYMKDRRPDDDDGENEGDDDRAHNIVDNGLISKTCLISFII